MLRIGAMNMTLHGIDNPSIENRYSLSEDHTLRNNAYTLMNMNLLAYTKYVFVAPVLLKRGVKR